MYAPQMFGADYYRRSDSGSRNADDAETTMNILLNYKHPPERLIEPLESLGHRVFLNIWQPGKIAGCKIDAVIFETKQILKREWEFLKLSIWLKKKGIPRITWCLDWPNVGAKPWKMKILQNLPLLDIFASHDIHGLKSYKMKIIYLPNAAWTSRYNLRDHSLAEMRNPSFYSFDVSFLGNLDHQNYPEHQDRILFLHKLREILEREKITYRFLNSRNLSFDEQVQIIQRSRINLNIGAAADGQLEKSWGLPERCYGVPACGGFLLTDERGHAADDFVVGKELITFKSLEDCLEKIKYYLRNFEETRWIAENAYKKVYEEHTYYHRAQKIIKMIEDFKLKR